MDKDDVNKEFEGLLIYNDIDVNELDPETDFDSDMTMSLTELSSISQDIQSMLWYVQEVITRTLEDNVASVHEDAIIILRQMQNQSIEVIEGMVLGDDDDDEDDD